MNYIILSDIVKLGVFNEMPEDAFCGAFNDGLYLGRPGRDIFDALPLLSEKEMGKIANLLANSYPLVPPLDHVGHALCIRLIYGNFDKNGTIRKISDIDLDRWKLASKFLSKFLHYLTLNNNIYGQCIYHEMTAHRLGDMAIVNCDNEILDKSLEHYRKCYYLALECKSYKHIFSSIYWGCEYLNKFNDDRCVDWAIESLELMDKYCPSKRYGYKAKAYAAMNIVYNKDQKRWENVFVFCKNSKQQPINKALKKMKNYVLTSNKDAVLIKKIKDVLYKYDKGIVSKKKCILIIRDILLEFPQNKIHKKINDILNLKHIDEVSLLEIKKYLNQCM